LKGYPFYCVATPPTTRDAIVGRKTALEEADALTAEKTAKVSKEVKRDEPQGGEDAPGAN
jgi:hypothetical protein